MTYCVVCNMDNRGEKAKENCQPISFPYNTEVPEVPISKKKFMAYFHRQVQIYHVSVWYVDFISRCTDGYHYSELHLDKNCLTSLCTCISGKC
jgi:hypothetical protein